MTPRRETCTVEGCGVKVYAKGWCQKHYMRVYRHGDPGIVLNHPRTHQPSTSRVGYPPHTVEECPSPFQYHLSFFACVCLTPEQYRDYVIGGDNARWLTLPVDQPS